MKMQRHHVPQGSDAWHALRNQPMTATASEAPAMMGCSPNVSRTELLNQKKTGITREFSDFVEERVFAQGHETEASFRPIAEEMIGDDLYPVTGTRLVDGITMLASFDGLTMDDRRGFEHKLFNADTAGCIAVEGEPPMHHVWQLEHQLMVCGGESILFATSDGTATNCETCIYTSMPERRAQLIAGWKRFFADLETHEVVAKTVKVEAEAVDALPAVSVRMDGQIIVSSNLDVFGQRLRAFVENLPKKPETDQDFANADAAVKALDKAEKALEAAKASAIAQVESVEKMTAAVDALIALSKTNRLALAKLVTARKEAIKVEVVTQAQQSLVNHIMALNARIGRPLMPRITADFGEAIKGKKSVDTLKSAAADELARAKTEADMMADRIIANLKVIEATGLPQLFADLATLVVRDPADMAVLVEARVTTHKAAEAKRQEELRERIRAEEVARLEREAEAERKTREAAEEMERKRTQDEAAALAHPSEYTPATNVTPITHRQQTLIPGHQITAANDQPKDHGVRIKLGDLQAELAPISINAEGLAALGFPPAMIDKNAKLYRECDIPAICDAIARHANAVAAKRLLAA